MEIKDITFSYQDNVVRLNNINCTIEKGKVTTIIGPNGSGKSTLLGIMSDQYHPKKGSIILNGKELHLYRLKELAKTIGVVHQNNIAPTDITVERLVFYGRLPHRNTFSTYSDKDREKVEWALKSTGLESKRNQPLDSLSGGQQQRAWIAMALAQDTPYLFLDEPTANLDIFYQYEVLQLVKHLNKTYGLTIVMVLHDINQAIQYSDKIIVMKKGKVFTKGKPEDIVSKKLIYDIYGVHVAVKDEPELGMHIIPLGI